MTFAYRRVISYFLRGLLFLTPLAVTSYVIYAIFIFLDNLIQVPIPGIGINYFLRVFGQSFLCKAFL
jgi:uncharacterized membrane protein